MIELINANTLTIPLAAQSVHMIAFSPPYWGLRSYQTGENKHAELGSEPLHDCLGWATGSNCGECFVCHLRQVASECWRVLRDDGVMFINLGDSYAGSSMTGGNNGFNAIGTHKLERQFVKSKRNAKRWGGGNLPAVGALKPKDLVGIPWRVALALQSDGWYLRSEIIWAKPNPMPESVTDRPTKAHEQVFLFSKRERYFYDAEAVREDGPLMVRHGNKPLGGVIGEGRNDRENFSRDIYYSGRNARTVWTIATAPYSGSHFATWPPALVERMIKAGTSERGACPKCGKQWTRVVEPTGHINRREPAHAPKSAPTKTDSTGWKPQNEPTGAWQPSCTCDAGDPNPAIVLDPFAGSGTTLMVARKLGRSAVGIDLSYTYLHDNARERLMLDALEEWENGKKAETSLEGLPMFGGAA